MIKFGEQNTLFMFYSSADVCLSLLLKQEASAGLHTKAVLGSVE